MTLPVEKWAESVRAGDVRAVSRAITAIENHQPEAEALLRLLFPHTGQAYLTGVTGAPGTGKSTLVDRLWAFFREKQGQGGGGRGGRARPEFGGGRFLAIASACKAMRGMAAYSFARWRPAVFSAAWREQPRKWCCCLMP